MASLDDKGFDVEPTDDGIPLQLARHTPEMWEEIEKNLPKLIKKLNHQNG